MVAHPYRGIPLAVLSGVGRSGTRALHEALGLHPLLHSTGCENNVLHDLLEVAHRNRTMESRRFSMQVDDATWDELFGGLVLDLLWPRPRAAPPRLLLCFSRLLPAVAGELVRLFPAARIVYMVRNGIEVVASRVRYPSFAGLPFEAHCAVWAQSAAMARWGRDRDDVLVVRHERLVDEAACAAALDEVWSFAGLPAEPACAEKLMATCRHPTRAGDERRRPAEALADRAERWRSWTAAQRRTFAESCGEAMRHFGYAIPWAAPPVRHPT